MSFPSISSGQPRLFSRPIGTILSFNKMRKKAKKIAIGITGGFVLLAGLAMIVLPGPAFIVIPAGLAILATEFEFAQRWLHHAREFIHRKREEHRAKKAAKRREKSAFVK